MGTPVDGATGWWTRPSYTRPGLGKNRFVDSGKGNGNPICFYCLSVCQSDADLQFFTEVLGVRNEAAVSVPFVEPGAAPDLRRLLLPIDGGPSAVIQLHVVSPSVRPHDHILWVWLNWKEGMKTDTSAHPRFTLLCFTGESAFEQCGGAVPELYVSSSWRESMMLKGSQILFDSTCLQ